MAGRPQVGIERLPVRRLSSEPRESMNCKSCRKRKIKCNRLRPTCEACHVFQCPCVYDAVPKKRGPKTDVLEALLKRVDGLERRLKDDKRSQATASVPQPNEHCIVVEANNVQPPHLDTIDVLRVSAVCSPPLSEGSPEIFNDVLLDTYFTRCHGKAYHIVNETTIRQRTQMNELPSYLLYAIYAVSARYTPHPDGYHGAVKLSEDYARRSRKELDLDEPSIDMLQTLLLLSVAFTASGKGKTAYMMLASGIGMVMALELHREPDMRTRTTPSERETRRRLFWTCYLMDRFTACGSKRPSLIADKCILLRLPSWSHNSASSPVDGEFFQNGSNLQCNPGFGKQSQGSSGMIIDIVRILGVTNRYLAAGGVKGDSHFPWHSLSNLSKIRHDVDVWASGTKDAFSSVDILFGQPDSTTLVLSKLIYHLIHCLLYRHFLPIDLAELAGSGQHQSWQIEATNLCFLHANAIAELVELGKRSIAIEWPAFVGYCICTAGTVHVHGAHYKNNPHNSDAVFSASADFLSREMQQLSELRYAWSSVQHQRDTLETIYGCHSELLRSLSASSMRHSPAFHLEDFFDRYSDLGLNFDGAHMSFTDLVVDPKNEALAGHTQNRARFNPTITCSSRFPSGPTSNPTPLARRKQSSSASRKKHNELRIHRRSLASEALISPRMSTPIQSPHSLPTPSEHPISGADPNESPQKGSPRKNNRAIIDSSPITPLTNYEATPTLAPFSPPCNFNALGQTDGVNNGGGYDPMFGLPASGFGWGGNSIGATPGAIPSDALGEGSTPGARSDGQSVRNGAEGDEKDPFFSLLEQLAENGHSRAGPNELDFFLSGGHG